MIVVISLDPSYFNPLFPQFVFCFILLILFLLAETLAFGLILNFGLSSKFQQILTPFLPISQGSLRYIKSSLLCISVSHNSYIETLISSMVVYLDKEVVIVR